MRDKFGIGPHTNTGAKAVEPVPFWPDDNHARTPCVKLGAGELMAVRRNIGSNTWVALKDALTHAEFCEDGRSFMENPPADLEYETPDLDVESLKKVLNQMSCNCSVLRARVLRGVANRTCDPAMLRYLSDLGPSYLPAHLSHELRMDVLNNSGRPIEIAIEYSQQDEDAELRDSAIKVLQTLEK